MSEDNIMFVFKIQELVQNRYIKKTKLYFLDQIGLIPIIDKSKKI